MSEMLNRNRRYLEEANIAGLLAEAASADVEVVLPDQTVAVTADAANEGKIPALRQVGSRGIPRAATRAKLAGVGVPGVRHAD